MKGLVYNHHYWDSLLMLKLLQNMFFLYIWFQCFCFKENSWKNSILLLYSRPLKTLKKTGKEFLCSIIFLGGFIASCKYLLCKFKNLRGAVDRILYNNIQ